MYSNSLFRRLSEIKKVEDTKEDTRNRQSKKDRKYNELKKTRRRR
jgi:hypothetical protein